MPLYTDLCLFYRNTTSQIKLYKSILNFTSLKMFYAFSSPNWIEIFFPRVFLNPRAFFPIQLYQGLPSSSHLEQIFLF